MESIGYHGNIETYLSFFKELFQKRQHSPREHVETRTLQKVAKIVYLLVCLLHTYCST